MIMRMKSIIKYLDNGQMMIFVSQSKYRNTPRTSVGLRMNNELIPKLVVPVRLNWSKLA